MHQHNHRHMQQQHHKKANGLEKKRKKQTNKRKNKTKEQQQTDNTSKQTSRETNKYNGTKNDRRKKYTVIHTKRSQSLYFVCNTVFRNLQISRDLRPSYHALPQCVVRTAANTFNINNRLHYKISGSIVAKCSPTDQRNDRHLQQQQQQQ